MNDAPISIIWKPQMGKHISKLKEKKKKKKTLLGKCHAWREEVIEDASTVNADERGSLVLT